MSVVDIIRYSGIGFMITGFLVLYYFIVMRNGLAP